ncbi:MAG: tRNA dimethylallyltransferase [Maribacter sp.]
MSKYLIVIVGATASGKTSLGIRLAQKYDTVILSADSRQFYREMSIGTAKPTEEELVAAPHHFIDNLSIHDKYSVGDYEKEAITLLDEIFETKDVALMVGGSGLFIKSVLEGLDEFPDVPNEIKEKLIQLEKEEGIEALQNMLKEKDPNYFSEVDIHNPHRLIRALSVIEASGKPFSSFRNQAAKKRNFQAIIIQLDWEREKLYERINQRVDLMLEAGLLDEVKSLLPLKYLNALQTVGYQEIFDYLDNNISKEEAIRLVKRNSRRYAKRQMTWLRKMENTKAFLPSDLDKIASYLDTIIDNVK